jgi:DNA-binding NarL/FixJ family response regulator
MERVLLADDHPLFREALRATINRVRPDLEVEEAESLAAAKEKLKTSSFALVLLDLKLTDSEGFLGLLTLRSEFPKTPVAIVSATEGPHAVQNAMAYGAAGYIPKSARASELADALAAIFAGDVWTPPEMEVAEPSREASLVASLSPAQARILAGVMRGRLNKQIAFDLGVTEATVRAHMTAVFRKLGVVNRTQAVILAQSAALGEVA